MLRGVRGQAKQTRQEQDGMMMIGMNRIRLATMMSLIVKAEFAQLKMTQNIERMTCFD